MLLFGGNVHYFCTWALWCVWGFCIYSGFALFVIFTLLAKWVSFCLSGFLKYRNILKYILTITPERTPIKEVSFYFTKLCVFFWIMELMPVNMIRYRVLKFTIQFFSSFPTTVYSCYFTFKLCELFNLVIPLSFTFIFLRFIVRCMKLLVT